MRSLVNSFLILVLLVAVEGVIATPRLNASSKQDNAQQTPAPEQQPPSSDQQQGQQQEPGQATSSASVSSVTGCVVQGDQGFMLKTESASYPIETDQDLSKYVNKEVRISGILEHHTGAAPSAEAGNSSVITDIRLRMVASVIGDCPQSK